MITIIRCFCLLFFLGLAQVVDASVFKCTAADGSVVFQGSPCISGDEAQIDMLFGEQEQRKPMAMLAGSWCELGTSKVLDGTVYRDEALSKTWVFAEHQMTQHIQQGQRQDTFNYNIRQQTGNFVIDHPAFGSGQVSWHVRRHTEQELVIAAYGNFTHLTAGECNVAMVRN
ncbi:hypothetical protein SAMN06297280_1406 [Arsukibacterium tuosuense]|uniref:DUF4124 domain-containing protein n=1 Tax=Arsukibacterium tuosuense TaxID=1323745 RepID=A0A285IR32_9GAMM|nr:DUF4124 domain-containing protein [Arsukibacterium tuosuense]SNY49421.1 hypothetical protein SAMN06297280_1406 [Arsukibacterium tuosuense]